MSLLLYAKRAAHFFFFFLSDNLFLNLQTLFLWLLVMITEPYDLELSLLLNK